MSAGKAAPPFYEAGLRECRTGTVRAIELRHRAWQLRGDGAKAYKEAQLTSQLNASADPNSVAAQTAGRVSSITTPPAFSPLPNFFANLTGAYNNAQQYAQSQQLLQGLGVNNANMGGAGATIYGGGSGGSMSLVK